MGTYSWRHRQYTGESRIYPVSFAEDLLTGGTITGASVTHTPPSGAPTTPTATVASPIVYVSFSPGSVAGVHRLIVSATVTNVGLPTETLRVVVDIQVDAP